MKKALLVTVAALCVLALPVRAQEAQQPAPVPVSDDFKFDVKYWDPELLDILSAGPQILPAAMAIVIKPYPANTSAETKSELAAMQKFSAEERTDAAVEAIKAEHVLVPLYRIFSQKGFYDFEKAPATNGLLATLDREVVYFTLREKQAMQRPRPTQLMPELTTVVPVPPHAAYPSGHAGQSYAAALLLAEIDPARAEQYKQLAIDIAHRREIAGVHYPSDSEAGRALAVQVVKALLAKPEIQERLAQAKKEFETAH